MRQINLKPREARMLKTALEGDAKGYDELDLQKLKWMAGKLTVIMGDYGVKLEQFVQEEKRVRRSFLRGQITQEKHDQALNGIRYDSEDLAEEANALPAQPWLLEEADYKMVLERMGDQKWFGAEDNRDVILGMLQALKEAAQVEPTVPNPVSDAFSDNGKAEHQSLELAGAKKKR